LSNDRDPREPSQLPHPLSRQHAREIMGERLAALLRPALDCVEAASRTLQTPGAVHLSCVNIVADQLRDLEREVKRAQSHGDLWEFPDRARHASDIALRAYRLAVAGAVAYSMALDVSNHFEAAMLEPCPETSRPDHGPSCGYCHGTDRKIHDDPNTCNHGRRQ